MPEKCANHVPINRNKFFLAAKTLAIWLALSTHLSAKPDSDFSVICETAAQKASHATGVPIAILNAISLTETGRKRGNKFRPWPWTVNMEGKGVWFDSEVEARTYAEKEFKRGARSFDVGCFQLNYRWHGKAFSSIEEMFDPDKNALYAAKFLNELLVEKGNWPDAAGAYHSRTPKYANKYRARFAKLLAKSSGATTSRAPDPPPLNPSPEQQEQVATINRFPLLLSKTDSSGVLGSLFPQTAGAGALPLLGGS